MTESLYNEILNTPEKVAYVYHRLIPGMVLMSVIAITIVVLMFFVWRRCGRKTAILLTVGAAILMSIDLLLIDMDYAMLHYCLTGECRVYKYGTTIARSLSGDFYCACLEAKAVIIVNILAIILLAIVLRLNKKALSSQKGS